MKTPQGLTPGATGPRRTLRDRSADADAEERRIGLPKLFGFVLAGWLAFGLIDVFIALFSPSTPRAWMIGWRAAGAVPPLVGWLAARRRPKVDRWSSLLEFATFVGLAFCLSMRALRYGGLDSHLVNGISLLLIVETMALPSRWRTRLPIALSTYAVYPAVFAVAALVEPSILAQWRSPDLLEGFVVDYSIVAACAVGGVVGGHLIWAMRRQLYYARRLGRYRLKARVGQGGSSEVWLAWDDALRRDVALKILDRSVSTDAKAIARFEREARAASALQSPHTIRVFDFGASDDGVWFIAMEHLEGADLASLVDEVGPLPAARVLRFARQACAALAEAHDVGVIHRDVKPDNLFVCRMGDEADFLKVVDFGVARIEGAEEDASVTRAGFVHGTPAYMSPEVCNGGRADARSDLYSLGAVLYFMLTGSPPFTAHTVTAVMLAHVNQPPEPPSRRAPAPVPADVEAVVLRCLEKDPAERYASARELDAALATCGGALTTTGERSFVADAVASRRHPLSPARAVPEDDARTLERPSLRGLKAR